jgi:hypothetical protein
MATKEKGLNRGGAGGQEGELGEDSKNLDVNKPDAGSMDQPGQQRGGMQGGSGRNSDLIRENLNPGGASQRGMNQQRGGLRREPDLERTEKDTDLERTEKDTGHEVD